MDIQEHKKGIEIKYDIKDRKKMNINLCKVIIKLEKKKQIKIR